ncbi:hypothetical protein OIU79_031326 [Salix purpurea]|uniref:Uncharacterized protein n=1 Tax=Salix purpurea TaxID=77065 RepID=A0A9Q0ZSQ7_SALPP|nr:hypothetical protein OIU79_031326 [Salix purpurea]
MDHNKYGGNNKIGFGQRQMLFLNQMNSSVTPVQCYCLKPLKKFCREDGFTTQTFMICTIHMKFCRYLS